MMRSLSLIPQVTLYATFLDFPDCRISFARPNNCFLNSAVVR